MIPRIIAAAVLALAASAFTVPADAATQPSPAAVAYAYATAQDGKPFAWGARGPYAYDCSGLIWAAYKRAGITLPRDTYQMVHDPRLVPVSRAEVRRGDLAFYGPPGAPEHVAMVDTAKVVFSAYRPGHPAGWSLNSRWWSPDAFYRVRDT